MANVSAFLKPTKGKQTTKVRFYISRGRNDKRLFYTSDIEVNPDHFDSKNGIIKSRISFYTDDERAKFNSLVSEAKTNILTAYNNAENKLELTSELLAIEIDKVLHPEKYISKEEEMPHTFFSFISDFIQKAPTRSIGKSGRFATENTIKDYGYSFGTLKDFAKFKNVDDFDFSDIDYKFYTDFVEFLQIEKNLSSNTIGSKIKHVKMWLNEAIKLDLTSNLKYKSFVKIQEESDNIALTEDELKAIFELDFSNDKSNTAVNYRLLVGDGKVKSYQLETLALVRDGFLLECWTGCRWSDLPKITKTNIKNEFLSIQQKKTGTEVIIPLLDVPMAILQKYDFAPPKPISKDKNNEMIKIVCRLAGITAIEEKKITKGGVKQVFTLERCERCSSHTGRRTMATMFYKQGFDTVSLMAITGHKTITSFLKYIKVTPQEHAEKLLKHFNEMKNKFK
jgi:site-specific recombinase XerD